MRRNKRNEQFFLSLVETGHLQVFKSGLIINNVTGKKVGQRKNGEYQRLGSFKFGTKKVGFYVHRLVWLVFRGSIPDGMEINHKNGVKHDNRLSNLELVTAEANVQHAYRTGLNPPSGARGATNGSAKLCEADIPAIFQLNARGWTCKRIGVRFGVGSKSIENVLTGKNWAHVAADRSNVKLKPKRAHTLLDAAKVRRIRKQYARGHSGRRLAQHYGVSAATISDIIVGKTWSHVA